MDETKYNHVLLALQVIHSANIPSHERDGAHKFLESFKEGDDCAFYAFYMFSTNRPEHSETVRHFALHVLESFLKSRWNTLHVEQQQEFRNRLMELMAKNTKSLTEEAGFVKEKIVQIVAEIAKRQFPQRWPEFVDQILDICALGDSQAELGLLVLRSVAEDCVNSDFNLSLPAQRRQDIFQGLQTYFPRLFPVVYRLLEAQYMLFKSNKSNSSTLLIKATLQMMKEFIGWVPFAQLVVDQMNFVYVFVALLSDQELKTVALDCLDMFTRKKVHKVDREVFLSTFVLVVENVSQLSFTNFDSSEELFFHHHLAKVLCNWTLTQLDLYLSDMTENESQLLGKFLQFMADFFKYPSVTISEIFVSYWIAVLKHHKIAQQNYIGHIRIQLWSHCIEKFFKLGSPDADLSPTSLCSQLEYDDHEEYNHAFGVVRAKLLGLIHQLSLHELDVGLNLIHQRLITVTHDFAIGRDHLDNLGYCTDSTTAFIYQEGITSLIDGVVKPIENFKNVQVNQLLNSILAKILEIDAQDPLILYRHMLVLASFRTFYSHDQTLLPQVLERLFRTCTFKSQREADVSIHKLGNKTIHTRRRALASLVTICKANSYQMLPIFSNLCTRTVELLQADAVLEAEKVLLYEMLVLVSNSMPDVSQQRNFLDQILVQPLAVWTAPKVTEALSSKENLIQLLEQEQTNSRDVRDSVWSIPSILSTFLGIAKRAKPPPSLDASSTYHPFSHVWPHILPNLFQMINLLHLLWEENTKNALRQRATTMGLLALTNDEIKVILPTYEEPSDSIQSESYRWAKWQRKVRECSYHLLAISTYCSSVFSMPKFNETMLGMISNSLIHMEHRHVKSLLANVLVPFTKNIPVNSYRELFEPICSIVLTHLAQRLSDAWIAKTGNSSWNAIVLQMDQVYLEVVQAQILSELTKSALDYVELLVDAKTVVGNDAKSRGHILSEKDRILRDFVLYQSQKIPGPLFFLLSGAICWPETVCCRRSIELIEAILPCIGENPKYFNILGRDIFGSALWVIINGMSHVKEDWIKWNLIALLKSIYCRLVLGLLPTEECKGIDPACQPQKSLDQLCVFPRQLLMTLPGITEEKLFMLDKNLREMPSEKQRKNLFKEFLEVPMLMSKGGGMENSASKKILNLPEKLFIASKELHREREDLPEMGLFSLYEN